MYHVLDRSESGTTSHQYCDIDYDAMTSVRPAERTAEDEVEMTEIAQNENNRRSKLRVELTPPDSSTTRTGRVIYDPVNESEQEHEFQPIEERECENDIEDNQQTTRG